MPEKRKRVKRGPRIPKDPMSADLRSRESFRSFMTPTDDRGEYIGELLKDIRPRVGKAYAEAKLSGAGTDYMAIVDRVLTNLGFTPERWERAAIYSALSRETHRKRREKKAAIEARRIDEARQAELALNVCD